MLSASAIDSHCYYEPLMCWDQIILVQHSQYHGCWCPGSLSRQDISAHDTDYVE